MGTTGTVPVKQPETFQEVLDAINAFTEVYPYTEYGTAHLSLSDYNLDNDELDRELAEAEALVGFLRWLRDIPEDIRDPEDDIWPS